MIPPLPPQLAAAGGASYIAAAGAGVNPLPPGLANLPPAAAAALGRLFPSASAAEAAAPAGVGSSTSSTGASPRGGGTLSRLLVLKLAGNRLNDIGDLERLAAVSSLEELTLAGNPLSRKSVSGPQVVREIGVGYAWVGCGWSLLVSVWPSLKWISEALMQFL